MAETSDDALLSSMRLEHARGVGAVTYRRLVRIFGSPANVLNASRERLLEVPDLTPRQAEAILAARNDPWAEQELERARNRGVGVLHLEHPEYPKALLRTYDPPVILYVHGELRAEDALSIAIVGSRHCTKYGQRQAGRLAAGLAAAGFTVISGLARGVDTAAHLGALSVNGGRTVAVLGNGIGTVYPPENKALYQRIADGGGAVLSEQPLDEPPHAKNFPGRNRIIAGLTLGTVVIEGELTSGSLITARYALDMNREIFALPGDVENPQSRGPHDLIQRGAKLVTDAADILEELKGVAAPLVKLRGTERALPVAAAQPGSAVKGARRSAARAEQDGAPLLEAAAAVSGAGGEAPAGPPLKTAADLNAAKLNERERAIFAQLDADTARPVDAIINGCGFPAQEVLASLMVFELRRLVKQLPGKRYVKA